MIDVEKLARESDCTHVNLSGDMAMATERLSRFAALVLEQVELAVEALDRVENHGCVTFTFSTATVSDCLEVIRAMKPEAK